MSDQALILRFGSDLWWSLPPFPPRRIPRVFLPGSAPLPRIEGDLARLLRDSEARDVWVSDIETQRLLGSLGIAARLGPGGAFRALRRAVRFGAEQAQSIREEAQRIWKKALQSPEEELVLLAREQNRLERLLRRETEAREGLIRGLSSPSPLTDYAELWAQTLTTLEERRQRLDQEIRRQAARLLPNTTALLGARTAAQLWALLPDRERLLRLPASRLQILGARRRTPGSTPRHGVLYQAEGMDRVPPPRRGALARSLASWATVALRADLITRGSLGLRLIQRREGRIRELSIPPRGRPSRRGSSGTGREGGRS